MRTPSLVLAFGLSLVPAAAIAQTPPAPKAPFGCDARAPNTCIFRIYLERGSREIFLAAGMKQGIPKVRVGIDKYCVALNKKPLPSCARKLTNSRHNS